MFSEKGRLEVGPTSYPQSFLCVLCALCANPVFNLWNERKPRYRAVAKRRSAYAAMPAQKPNTCQLESWRSQKDPLCVTFFSRFSLPENQTPPLY